jgi:hypothetical protein
VVFKEVESTSRNEDEPKEPEPEKVEFELKNEGSKSFEEVESSESNDEVEPHTPVLRRFVHARRPTARYSPPDIHSDFVLSCINDEPRSVTEAINYEERKLWKKAMVEEMEALEKNEAWDLVEFLDGRKPVGRKWVFKKKLNATRKVEKYKAFLVAKGYS